MGATQSAQLSEVPLIQARLIPYNCERRAEQYFASMDYYRAEYIGKDLIGMLEYFDNMDDSTKSELGHSNVQLYREYCSLLLRTLTLRKRFLPFAKLNNAKKAYQECGKFTKLFDSSIRAVYSLCYRADPLCPDYPSTIWTSQLIHGLELLELIFELPRPTAIVIPFNGLEEYGLSWTPARRSAGRS